MPGTLSNSEHSQKLKINPCDRNLEFLRTEKRWGSETWSKSQSNQDCYFTLERFQIVNTSNFGQKWILRLTFRTLINLSVLTLEKSLLPIYLLHMYSETICLKQILVKCLEDCQIANIHKIRKSTHLIEILKMDFMLNFSHDHKSLSFDFRKVLITYLPSAFGYTEAHYV